MYKIIRNDSDISYGVKIFVCDTVEDIPTLPACEMGSKVFVIGTTTTYIKDGANHWIILPAGSNSSSGGSSNPSIPSDNKIIYEGGII